MRELGSGGMAVVYLARDTKHDREVALKVIRPDVARGIAQERFTREIRIAGRLQHPNIVPLFDSGNFGGRLYFVMPHVSGETLRDLLAREGRLPIGDSLRILREVAGALDYAHNHDVVHRDIKPENVLLTTSRAVVSDFGIAYATSSAQEADGTRDATLTQAGTSLGTPAYMAPEQVAGDRNTDHRADIYSFGVVGYELLTGKPPFTGTTSQHLMAAHIAQVPFPLAELRPDTPPVLAEMLMRCLEKNPANRPQSAAEIEIALETAAAGDSGWRTADRLVALRRSTKRALAVYAVSFGLVVSLAWLAMKFIGLPDWVFPSAFLVMALGLPLIFFAGYVQRAAVRSSTFVSGSRPTVSRRRELRPLLQRLRPYASWKRVAFSGAGGVGAFGFAIGGYMAMRGLGIGPAGTLIAGGSLSESARILVTDFRVAGTDSSIGAAAAVAIRTALGQSSVVTLYSTDSLSAALERMRRSRDARLDLQLAREVATREGIPGIVDGHVIRIGNGYDVGIRLVSAESGDELFSGHQMAAGLEGILPALDDLSRKLRAKIGESFRSVRASPPLPQVTTKSLAALQLYALGMEAGNTETAVNFLRQAVKADSEFAMAYRRLGVLSLNLRLGDSDSATLKAYRYSDRLPEQERLAVTASYYALPGHGGDRPKAIDAYERLMAMGDSGWAVNLANLYRFRREYAKAESLLIAVARIYKDDGHWDDLLSVQIDMGKLDAAERTLRAGRARFPDSEVLRDWTAFMLYHHGDADGFERIVDSLRALPDPLTRRSATRAKLNLALTRGRLQEAQRLRQELAVSEGASTGLRPGDRTREIQINLMIRQDTARALRLIEEDPASAPADLGGNPRRLLELAPLFARVKQPARARQYLARYERLADTAMRRKNIHDYHVALADIALAEHRYDDAIAEFRLGDRLPDGPRNPIWYQLNGRLAKVLDAAGRTDAAIVNYQRWAHALGGFRATTPDLELARVLERLGQLHAQRGDRVRAQEYYSRFIELWKDADPELQPRVTAARQALAKLGVAPQRLGPLPWARPGPGPPL